MTILIALLALFDAVVLPVKGLLSSVIFVVFTGLGVWKIRDYKSWFILSLVFITLAVLFYFIGSGVVDETVVRKLSDWSYIYLIIGALRLAHAKHG
ncbi:MAG: hypothetical protein G01um101416_56 [Microgenomates group bacterium Gr01-1014_16]|nr:MAG: hypothetical protein G01um101416_56 [Microgenomates group bacterium Gr01-1014_16]